MTALKDRVVARIRAAGPMRIDEYMALCLFDPAHGYYTSRDPFGAKGDFVTAPEISQMFGELVASWLASAWIAAGRPEKPVLAEIGPGSGALMADMLRTLAKIAPDFLAVAEIVLVEASPRLAAIQREKLGGFAGERNWAATIADLPAGPLFIVGNELFDALPVRQFQRTGGQWRERLVALDRGGEPAFALGPPADPRLPPQAVSCGEGDIVEVAPGREALMAEIAGKIARHGGGGLFFDYGEESGFGDTLQAVANHAPAGVFDRPGEADLTTHVDFGALMDAARAAGLDAALTPQGEFLMALGIDERAARLAAGKDAATAARIGRERDRLVGEREMGRLFKALAIAPPRFPLYPFVDG